MEKEKKDKKKKGPVILIIIFAFIIGAGAITYQFFRYESYDVEATYERNDEEGTQYAGFGSNLIKYSSDGAFYTKEDGSLIWNISYEYANPTLKTAGDYILLYDERGTGLELLNKTGSVLSLDMNMTIRRAAVSGNGVTAVLMEENHVSYLKLYASDGTVVAEGTIYPQNSGFPIALALSSDGKLLMVSELDIADKDMTSRIVFYNFGRVGQNESDNIVSSYEYKDEIIPDVAFMDNDTPIAFGGSKIYLFTNSEKPDESKTIEYETTIRSIACNGKNFVVISDNDDPKDTNAYLMEIFNRSGRRTGHRTFDYEYDMVDIIESNQVVLVSGPVVNLYSRIGVNSFSGEMDGNVYAVLSRGNGSYTVIQNNSSSRIRLR